MEYNMQYNIAIYGIIDVKTIEFDIYSERDEIVNTLGTSQITLMNIEAKTSDEALVTSVKLCHEYYTAYKDCKYQLSCNGDIINTPLLLANKNIVNVPKDILKYFCGRFVLGHPVDFMSLSFKCLNRDA